MTCGRGVRAKAFFGFSPKKALLFGFYLPPYNLPFKGVCVARTRQRPHGRGSGLRAEGSCTRGHSVHARGGIAHMHAGA